jgi:hypothetical protein
MATPEIEIHAPEDSLGAEASLQIPRLNRVDDQRGSLTDESNQKT